MICKYIKDIPSKNDVVFLRDTERNVAIDEENDPPLIQNILMRVRPRMVHNLMLKYVQDGGFDGARDFTRKLLISLSALRKYCPN